MSNVMKLSNVKGTRDFSPSEMVVRERIIDAAKAVFRRYGFLPLDTPALEYMEVLNAKGVGGEDVRDETYNFEDKSGREIGLRYDLTVPTARFLAMNPNLPLPVKRYQSGRCWRYGDIKKGRYREFYQFDADVFGAKSMLADAEVIAASLQVYKELGIKVTMRINSRKILSSLARYVGVKDEDEMFRAIDKLDKIGIKGVEKELERRGIKEASKITDFIKTKDLKKAIGLLDQGGKEGFAEIEELAGYLRSMGVKNFVLDLSLARGMDYYTGPVFEASCDGIGVSVGGGGRYDKLIGVLSGRDIAATGFSLGIEPIFEIMKGKVRVSADIFIANVGADKKVIKIAKKLRKSNKVVRIDLMGRSLKKQLDYANRIGVPKVYIVGKKEAKVTVKDMKTGKEKKVEI
jgi:histidyl-tRNA synthetase